MRLDSGDSMFFMHFSWMRDKLCLNVTDADFYDAEIPVSSKEGKGSNGGRRNSLGFKERIGLLRILLKTWKHTTFK